MVQDGEIGTLTGDKLVADIETGEAAPFDGKVTRLRAIWPETDAVAGVTVSVNQAQRRGDTGQVRSASNMQASGRMPLQANGKYMTVRVEIDDQDWSYIEGFVFEASPGGLRK